MESGNILKSHRGVYLVQNSFFILEMKLFFVILFLHLLADFDTIVQEEIISLESTIQVGHFIFYNLFLFVINLILISRIVINWVFHRYFIDAENKRLYEETGFFRVREKMYDLSLMRSITLNHSFFGRIFRFGSIEIATSASGGFQDSITLKNISNPTEISILLKSILQREGSPS